MYQPPEEIQNNIKTILGDLLPKQYSDGKPIKLTRGEGCDECNQTGYLGRIAIIEVLKISTTINTMILRQISSREIEEQAKKEGMITIMQDGYLKVIDGITTVEEILRVAEA